MGNGCLNCPPTRVVWEGTTAHTAMTLLAQPADGEERGALEEAQDFLRHVLSDGRRPSKEVQAEARAAGITDATLRRARAAIGIQPSRDGFGPGAVWYWSLPAATIDAHEPHRCSHSESEHQWKEMSIYEDDAATPSPASRTIDAQDDHRCSLPESEQLWSEMSNYGDGVETTPAGDWEEGEL